MSSKQYAVAITVAIMLALARPGVVPALEPARSDREERELKGPVWMLVAREALFHKVGEEWKEKFWSYREPATLFDGDGNRYATMSVGARNAIRFYCTTYAEAGRRLTEAQCAQDGQIDPKTGTVATYTYDAKGRLIEARTERVGEYIFTRRYRYDDRGRLIESERVTVMLDEGRPVQTTGWRTSYMYSDSDEQVREEVSYRLDQREGDVLQAYPQWRIVHSYEANGQVRVSELYKAIASGPGWPKFRTYTTTYDAAGNPVEILYSDANGKPYRKEITSYEYDEQGNWMKRTVTTYMSLAAGLVPAYRTVSYQDILYYPPKHSFEFSRDEPGRALFSP